MSTENQQNTALATTPQRPAPIATTESNAGMNPFASGANFEAALKQARVFAASELVPKDYQGKVQNCLIAMELASRIGCPTFAVMQNMDIIHGRPGLRASFLIATVNASKRFTPLRFQWEENGEPTNPLGCAKRGDSFGCRAIAKDLATGEECIGALISWGMVKSEGWSKKPGSKWLTMPEQMFMYRAGGFWTRVYSPEIGLGVYTREEVVDTVGFTVDERTVPPQRQAHALTASLLSESHAAPSSGQDVRADEDGVIQDGEREPGEEG